jgi:hypothetical protein|tara:strand:+ start:105627 stop:105767 length:141 start_codon:yes stop_codon:yes gene_type:complete
MQIMVELRARDQNAMHKGLFWFIKMKSVSYTGILFALLLGSSSSVA